MTFTLPKSDQIIHMKPEFQAGALRTEQPLNSGLCPCRLIANESAYPPVTNMSKRKTVLFFWKNNHFLLQHSKMFNAIFIWIHLPLNILRKVNMFGLQWFPGLRQSKDAPRPAILRLRAAPKRSPQVLKPRCITFDTEVRAVWSERLLYSPVLAAKMDRFQWLTVPNFQSSSDP